MEKRKLYCLCILGCSILSLPSWCAAEGRVTEETKIQTAEELQSLQYQRQNAERLNETLEQQRRSFEAFVAAAPTKTDHSDEESSANETDAK